MTKKESKQLYLSTEVKTAIAENLYPTIKKRNFQKLAIKYYYVVNLLFTNRIFFKDLYKSNGVAISTQTLFKLFKNYEDGSEILGNLQDWGIIKMEKNYNYSEGKARRYKLTPEFESSKTSILKVNKTEAPFILTLINRSEEAKKEKNFLIDTQLNILNKKVSVSNEGIEFLINRYPELAETLNNYNPKKAVSIPENLKIDDTDMPFISFLTKEFYCVRPDKESRIYSNFTSLKREYRAFILLDGKPLIGTDISNSQVLFSVPVIDGKLKEMNKRTFFIPPADFREFKTLAERGQIYEAIYQPIGEEIEHEDLSGKVRSVFKDKFFGDLFYCKAGKDSVIGDIAKDKFPNVYAAINQIKIDESYNQFAIKCQRMESLVMCDKVYSKLLKRRITALTLHDSIYVSNEKDAAVVKALIEEELYKEYKLKVTVTTKIETIDEEEINRIIVPPIPDIKEKSSKLKKPTIKEVVIEKSELEANREWIIDYIGISVDNDNTVEFNSFVVNLNGLLVYSKENGEESQLTGTSELKQLIDDDFERTFGCKLYA